MLKRQGSETNTHRPAFSVVLQALYIDRLQRKVDRLRYISERIFTGKF